MSHSSDLWFGAVFYGVLGVLVVVLTIGWWFGPAERHIRRTRRADRRKERRS